MLRQLFLLCGALKYDMMKTPKLPCDEVFRRQKREKRKNRRKGEKGMKFYGKIFCAVLAALMLSTSAPAFAEDTPAESAPGEIKLYADFG